MSHSQESQLEVFSVNIKEEHHMRKWDSKNRSCLIIWKTNKCENIQSYEWAIELTKKLLKLSLQIVKSDLEIDNINFSEIHFNEWREVNKIGHSLH